MANSLLLALMTFVQANTGLAVPDATPLMKVLPAKQIHYMAQPNVPYDGEPSFHGLHRNGFIFLAEPWSRHNPADRARLLHEVVHYMQGQSDRAYRCDGAKEAEAYALQRAYLKTNGGDLSSLPNALRIQAASTCHPAGKAARY